MLIEDRCSITAGCNKPFETTIVAWAGGVGWVFDCCNACAIKKVDEMSGGLIDARNNCQTRWHVES